MPSLHNNQCYSLHLSVVRMLWLISVHTNTGGQYTVCINATYCLKSQLQTRSQTALVSPALRWLIVSLLKGFWQAVMGMESSEKLRPLWRADLGLIRVHQNKVFSWESVTLSINIYQQAHVREGHLMLCCPVVCWYDLLCTEVAMADRLCPTLLISVNLNVTDYCLSLQDGWRGSNRWGEFHVRFELYGTIALRLLQEQCKKFDWCDQKTRINDANMDKISIMTFYSFIFTITGTSS